VQKALAESLEKLFPTYKRGTLPLLACKRILPAGNMDFVTCGIYQLCTKVYRGVFLYGDVPKLLDLRLVVDSRSFGMAEPEYANCVTFTNEGLAGARVMYNHGNKSFTL
jgi:hypothetical protein